MNQLQKNEIILKGLSLLDTAVRNSKMPESKRLGELTRIKYIIYDIKHENQILLDQQKTV
jgi:hypothetical protein